MVVAVEGEVDEVEVPLVGRLRGVAKREKLRVSSSIGERWREESRGL